MLQGDARNLTPTHSVFRLMFRPVVVGQCVILFSPKMKEEGNITNKNMPKSTLFGPAGKRGRKDQERDGNSGGKINDVLLLSSRVLICGVQDLNGIRVYCFIAAILDP